jgi:hypothetical protein
MQVSFVKSFVFFLAVISTAMLTSCQKETLVTPESTTTEQWVLFDQTWDVTIRTNATTTLTAVPATGVALNAVSILAAHLPVTVTNRLRDDKVNLSNITEAWAVSGGGFILKIQGGNENFVYWFENNTAIKSIGRVAL